MDCDNCGFSVGSSELHQCPYAADIENDYSEEGFCNCCEECTQVCADDI